MCVIDGDAAVRDSLETLMALSGLEVATYATGGDFLSAVNGSPVDCVICEAELPDTTGIDLFQAFKPRHPTTRFALLVSRNDPVLRAAAERHGVDAVFNKPLVHRKLTGFVRST